MAKRLQWHTAPDGMTMMAGRPVSTNDPYREGEIHLYCFIRFSPCAGVYRWRSELLFHRRTLARVSGRLKDIRDAMNLAEEQAPKLVAMALEDAERLYGKLVKVNERNKSKAAQEGGNHV